jgi:hypothetical protein
VKRSGCFGADEAGDVFALPERDPRREHARTCPRCGALLESYRAFALAEEPAVPRAELADADARLTRVLEELAGPPAAAHRGRVREAGPGFWERLRYPAMRPALAFAALALVLGGAWLGTRAMHRESGVVLRGEAPAPTIVIERAERSAGALHLAWRTFSGADAYEAHFYSGELVEIGRLPLHGTRADLPIATLPFRPAPGGILLVRVIALAHGDPIATSSARPVAGR